MAISTQVFWCNGLIILSNGSKAKDWQHDSRVRALCRMEKIDEEKDPGIISLETMIRAPREKRKLLDLEENFTLF